MEFKFEGLSIYEAFKKGRELRPKEAAIWFEGRQISFNKTDALIDKFAAILHNTLGICKGDILLVAQPNIPQAVFFFYAINKIGAVANFVHPLTPFNQMKAIMESNDVKYAFLFEQAVSKEHEKYESIKDKIFITRVETYLSPFKKWGYHLFYNGKVRKSLKGFTYFDDLSCDSLETETVTSWANETAVILHSGSTTGDPKVICLSNTNVNFIAAHGEEYCCVDFSSLKREGLLSVLPSFHGFGLVMTIHTPLTNGFATVQIPDFSPKAVTKAINSYPMLVICGVPNMYARLLQYKPFRKCKGLKNLHVAWCGGDVLPQALKEDFDKVCRDNGSKYGALYEGYGLTEAVTATILNTHDHHCEGAIGYPGSGVEVKIVDENRKEVPLGETGELATRSLANMVGYYKDEDATKACIDEEGWLYTGDLASMNEEGFVFFKQRIKRVIKISGVAIFPSEVEKHIETIKGVREVCAISIPSKKTGVGIKVFVVGSYSDEEAMRDTILVSCQQNLIRWAVPQEIEFRKSLPHTMIGKVDYKVLQQEEDEKRKINN
ncbi:MAG: acyl--CoA ligase [Coprobacillus sp.]|nr:acyl--CoA ligase [Coprobacillus sp.]